MAGTRRLVNRVQGEKYATGYAARTCRWRTKKELKKNEENRNMECSSYATNWKTENSRDESERYNIDICGLAEIHYGYLLTEENTIYYSCNAN